MKYRSVTLLALTAQFADNRTITIDLDMADPISEIYLDVRAKNNGGFPTVGPPLDTVTKIEIVDGSDVLYSLDGIEAEALDIYHSGQWPRGQRNTYEAAQENTHVVAISFGRWLWDEVLAFDPQHFSNPQLRVTFDYDAGGKTPNYAKLKVIAAMFDEKAISPSGFLMTKEIKRWSHAAVGHEYTDLPTDYPYRKLFLQSRYNDNPPNWIFAHIKLSSDQDKKVIIDNELLELVSGIAKENAYVYESMTASPSGGATHIHVTPTMDVIATAAQLVVDEAPAWACAVAGGDGGYLDYYTSIMHPANLRVSGMCPHGTIAIPFGLQNEIDDWFDVAPIGNLKLDVTSGVITAVQKCFIQQYRPY